MGLAAADDGFGAGGGVGADPVGAENPLVGLSTLIEVFGLLPTFGCGVGFGIYGPLVTQGAAGRPGFGLGPAGKVGIAAALVVVVKLGVAGRAADVAPRIVAVAVNVALSCRKGRGSAGNRGVGSSPRGIGSAGVVEAFDDFLAAALFLGELKDAFAGDAGYAGFAVGEVAFLGGEEAAEAAVLALVDGVVAFVAVFAGFPGFGFGEGVGLVDGAVEGFAAVGGEGFEDGGDAGVRGVGYGGGGLPVGAVPGDGTGGGMGRVRPPPLR